MVSRALVIRYFKTNDKVKVAKTLNFHKLTALFLLFIFYFAASFNGEIKTFI